MNYLSKKFRKYFIIAQTNMQNHIAYSSAFISEVLFYILIIFLFSQIWGTVFKSRQTNLAGYNRQQLIWYIIVTEFLALSSSRVFWQISEKIKTGAIAYELGRPYHYVLYQFANGLGFIGLKCALNGLLGICLGLIMAGPIRNFNIASLPLVLISLFSGLILHFFLHACIGLTAFWFEENTAFIWIYQKLSLILGIMLPLDLMPVWLQNTAKYLPFTYIFYGPAKLFLNFNFDFFKQIISLQFIYLFFSVSLCFFIYRKGVKNVALNGG